MTDKEITRLCAEAMGLSVVEQLGGLRFPNTQIQDSLYDPLHDDAQAMALVKRFEPRIWPGDDEWEVSFPTEPILVHNTDLNRAICECVAKMQKSLAANK